VGAYQVTRINSHKARKKKEKKKEKKASPFRDQNDL
jgi:hypothetical protein